MPSNAEVAEGQHAVDGPCEIVEAPVTEQAAALDEQPSVGGSVWDHPSISHGLAAGVVSVSETAQSHAAVVVFDWDDTLLSSSALASRGHSLDSVELEPELVASLQALEKAVVEVLTTAQRHSTVVIITNAETGWVQLSCQKFIPGVLPYIERIPVVSARSMYEGQYPDSPLKWKYCAFLEQITNLFNSVPVHAPKPKHIISFGDSQVEREAVRAMSPCFPDALIKSVKFAERPSLEELCRQVELVTSCFHSILTHEGELDLMLTVHVPGN